MDPERQRRQLIGIGFVLAFALSTATLIYTGLNVRAPGSARESAAPEAPLAPEPGSAQAPADPAEPEAAGEQPEKTDPAAL